MTILSLQETGRCPLGKAVVAGQGLSALSCSLFTVVRSRYAQGCELGRQGLGCLLSPAESSTCWWFGQRGKGAQQEFPAANSCSWTRQGWQSPELPSVQSYLALQRLETLERNSDASLRQTIQFFFCGVSHKCCKASFLPIQARGMELQNLRVHFCLIPPSFPFLGTQCEEGLSLPPDLTLVGNWTSHEAHQDPGTPVSSYESHGSDKACETNM